MSVPGGYLIFSPEATVRTVLIPLDFNNYWLIAAV